MPIVTSVYRLSRSELMLLTAREYLSSFWWFVIVTPLFGLAAIIFGNGILQVIGFMAVLWPFSIPARSVLASGRSSKLLTDGCRAEVDEDRVVFLGEKTEPRQLRMILEPAAIRDTVIRGEYVLIRTRKLGFVPIRREAITAGEEGLLRGKVAALAAMGWQVPDGVG